MACRPAGMSDEESDDESETSYRDKTRRRSNNNWSTQNGNGGTASNFLISKDEQIRREKQELEFTVLSACMSGNLEIIEDYIKAGHNVNEFLHTGWTLLLYGASSVLPDVVELLIKNGAKANKNKNGSTPLMEVCQSTKGTTDQCIRCISILIEAKANPNSHNKLMKTPLMLACQARDEEVVEELLKHVKGIDAVDTEGRTALHYATLANNIETVKLLLKKDALTTIADRRSLTARDIAVTKGYEKIIALLDSEDNGYADDYIDLTPINSWRDIFPALSGDVSKNINSDIAEILGGMGLQSYSSIFKGMELNTFLRLTDEDLEKMGMDIAMHRKQFTDNLYKFHTKTWSIKSLGCINKFMPYTLYDGVKLLGNAARQIRVIGSSFQFIKSGLGKAKAKGIILSEIEKIQYKEELRKTEETLLLLKKDLGQVMALAKKVEKENRGMESASYIGPKGNKYNWTIIMSITLMTGMYLSKTSFVQRLWNN